MGPQPFVPRFIIRDHGFHFRPKPTRMVLLRQMRQLVDDDIVDDLDRRHHQPPGEIHIPGRAAGTPAMRRTANFDRRIFQVHLAHQSLSAFRNYFLRLLLVPGNNFFGSLRQETGREK